MSSPKTPPVTPDSPQLVRFKRLQKVLQLLKYFLISSVILTLMEVGYVYWLLSSRWHLLLSRDEMTHYGNIVKEAPPLPENFMRVYTAIFPNHVNTSMSTQIFVNYGSRLLFRHTALDEKPHCFCDLVYDIMRKEDQYLYDLEWDGRLQDLEFGFGIEKFVEPSDCFEYVANYRIQELRQWIDPKKYPSIVTKSLSEFTDDELIEFILVLKSKAKITRYKTPAKFEMEFSKYKAKVSLAATE